MLCSSLSIIILGALELTWGGSWVSTDQLWRSRALFGRSKEQGTPGVNIRPPKPHKAQSEGAV